MKSNEIKISVITPTFNSEEYLRENLESVWNKSIPDEQIIVDANSTDKTLAIVKEFQDKGFNIKIYFRDPKGISDAMNYGIKIAGGDFIQVLHSDDYNIDTDIYNKVRTILQSVNCHWIYGLVRTADQNRQTVGKQPPWFIKNYSFSLLCLINFIPHASSFIKKEVFETYGYFDTKLKIVMDWDYWLRIGNKIKPYIINEYWCTERLHRNSLSTREAFSRQMRMEERVVLKRYLNFLSYQPIHTLQLLISFIRFLKRSIIRSGYAVGIRS